MPKFIGNDIAAAKQIQDNASPHPSRVKLSYSQAVLLPPAFVSKSLNTTDRGSKGSYAKRWYEWYASPEDILACPASTPKMRDAAEKQLHPA